MCLVRKVLSAFAVVAMSGTLGIAVGSLNAIGGPENCQGSRCEETMCLSSVGSGTWCYQYGGGCNTYVCPREE